MAEAPYTEGAPIRASRFRDAKVYASRGVGSRTAYELSSVVARAIARPIPFVRNYVSASAMAEHM